PSTGLKAGAQDRSEFRVGRIDQSRGLRHRQVARANAVGIAEWLHPSPGHVGIDLAGAEGVVERRSQRRPIPLGGSAATTTDLGITIVVLAILLRLAGAGARPCWCLGQVIAPVL